MLSAENTRLLYMQKIIDKLESEIKYAISVYHTECTIEFPDIDRCIIIAIELAQDAGYICKRNGDCLTIYW